MICLQLVDTYCCERIFLHIEATIHSCFEIFYLGFTTFSYRSYELKSVVNGSGSSSLRNKEAIHNGKYSRCFYLKAQHHEIILWRLITLLSDIGGPTVLWLGPKQRKSIDVFLYIYIYIYI